MSLPTRSETRKQRELVEQTRATVRRAKALAKQLEELRPISGDKKLRRAAKGSVRQIKKAVAETERLAAWWDERIERDGG